MIKTEKYKQNIPMELREYKQWLWFKKIRKMDLKGREKTLKMPVSPITLKSTDWNNKENWADFETAVNNIESSGCDGLSFVLSKEDPFLCIDLDNVSHDMREMFCRDFYDTYIETSQSGKGLHIFAKGKITYNFNNQIKKVEIYQNNRCIAMTGNSVDGTPNNIVDKQKEIDKYYACFAPKKSIREQIKAYQSDNDLLPDAPKIIETMCKQNTKAKGLFEGTISSGDASKDDFLLLLLLNSYTHGNEVLMKDIFLKSALNRIDDKSKRKNEAAYIRYLEDSIKKAIQYRNQRYWDYNSKLLPKYLGAEDTKLNAWIMKHMLVGMVKRVFNPGCKFDELMVLTGIQGVGKTSFIEKLALFPEWYCSLNNIKGKDAVSNLVGKVVVELEEFVALRNAKSADEAKLFISARTSTVRLPYERFSADVKRTCILIATTNDATFLGDFSGERRYLPVKVNSENIELPIMYDAEKFPVLETITREEHYNIVEHDFEGAIAEAVHLYENKLHDFYLPKELRSDLDFVIQTHKSENRHVQNFLDFMEWKSTKSDTPDLLCSTEFTSRYPETNEKVFSEMMANEVADEWTLDPSIKSKKVRIDGVVRVSKKFYKRSVKTGFVEVEDMEIPF